jgi:hypothetical protein
MQVHDGSMHACMRPAQAGVEAEMYANSPGLLRRVLAELLQHTLATFATILAEQLPGSCPAPRASVLNPSPASFASGPA